ncbi:MAG: hypothetical protein NXH75_06190 [Halobacteriovoraceae bacterium]|nr:hypothetical protein [Halobacteriovoraceae bacterium]
MDKGEEHRNNEVRPLIYKNLLGEGILIGTILFASIVIPSFKAELFPYSSFALFTDSPQRFVEYQITDGNGQNLKLDDFFLQRNYYGISPREPYARVKPPSFDKFGTILKEDKLKKAILMGYEKNPELVLPIKVSQSVFRPTKNGVKKTKVFNYELSVERKWENTSND